MVEQTFNRFKKYKAAPSRAKRMMLKAQKQAENRIIHIVCSCPKNMVRFSDLSQTTREKLVAKKAKVEYKYTTGKHGKAKLVGFTFFPFDGSYPTLKAGREIFSLDGRKILVSQRLVNSLKKKRKKCK